MSEHNPFRAHLGSSSETLEDDLRRQQEILRSQHNKTQAGDTTFGLDLLKTYYATQEFTLGSLGRFRGETGILQARFCKMTQFVGVSEGISALPVGFLADRVGFAWEVTNDRSKSGVDLAAGIGFWESWPDGDFYGWVVTHGPNIAPIAISESVDPGAAMVWGDSGELSPGLPGVVLGRSVVSNDSDFLSPGELLINLEPFSQAEVDEKLDDLEGQFELGLGALDARVANLESTVTTQTETQPATDARFDELNAKIDFESGARQRADESIRSLILPGDNWGQVIETSADTLRAEFSTQIDTTNAQVSNLTTELTALQLRLTPIDFTSIQTQIDNTVNILGDLSGRLNEKLDLGGGTLTGDLNVPDEVYGVSWDGSTEVPTKNAVYDKLEAVIATIPAAGPTLGWSVAGSWTWSTNVTTVDFTGLGNYESIVVHLIGITLSASGLRRAQVSIDNGVNWRTTSGDYVEIDANGVETNGVQLQLHNNTTNLARGQSFRIDGNISGAQKLIQIRGNVFVRFTHVDAISAIRIIVDGAINFTGGSIQVLGLSLN